MGRLYAGIDLHSNNNVVVITDEADTVVYRKRRRNDLGAVLEALAPFGKQLEGVVVESTYNWYWLVDGLMAEGYQVHLANTNALQQYTGLKYADDESDAGWLAKLLRLGILREGYIYPRAERPVRDLLRKRAHLVRQRTANILSVQNLLARNTGQNISGAGVKHLDEASVEEMLPNQDLALAVHSSVAVMGCLDTQIARLEKVVLKRVRLREEFQGLLTVPGIGPILALTIVLEMGDIHRFPDVGDFASYARCVNGSRNSNNKRKGGVNTKNGNAHLAWAFMEAAHYAVQYDETIERYYQRKLSKVHVMVARKTVAHKLARACYHILRDHTTFDVTRAFGPSKGRKRLDETASSPRD
jgi:transposase